MKLFRILIVTVCVLTFCGVAGAQTITYNNDDFLTEGRKVVVKGCDNQTKVELSEKLLQHGSVVMEGLFSKIFYASVAFKHTPTIQGDRVAYQIVSNSKKVVIKFTNPEMMHLAVDRLLELFVEDRGMRVIKGANVLYLGSSNAIAIRSNSNGVYDGVSSKLSERKVLSAINTKLSKTHGSDFTLAVANSTLSRVNFTVFEGINPAVTNYASGEYYSVAEIQKFVAQARSKGGEFVMAIDLLSQNERFEDLTGHSISSVEGMRFVRAMLEEYANVWGIKTLCIGTEKKIEVSQGYIDFLYDIAGRNSLELIIL